MPSVQLLLLKQVDVVTCQHEYPLLLDVVPGQLDDLGLEHDRLIRVIECLHHVLSDEDFC
jgi:hypothetical protein